MLARDKPVTCCPADLLAPEIGKLTAELRKLAEEHGIKLAENEIEDVLIYALFPQVGWKFLQERGNPAAFEPPPRETIAPASVPPTGVPPSHAPASYTVVVNRQAYHPATAAQAAAQGGTKITPPMPGIIPEVTVSPGEGVQEGDVIVLMEAMKMETEIRTKQAGTVQSVLVKAGDVVAADDILVTLD